MPDDNLTIKTDGATQIITFQRPEKKNALTQGMYTGLLNALDKADADPSIRVIIITGAGQTFTAGNDLGDFMANAAVDEHKAPVMQVLLKLADLKKPLIAAVDGGAIGIGTTLLLHADYVLATARARFQMPFVNLGLCPEGASSVLLPALVGMARASEWLLWGEPIDAAAAHAAGLVNCLVAPEELHERALARAQSLSGRPPGSVMLTKRLLRDPLRQQVKDAIGREAGFFAERLRSAEASAALQSFFSRRLAQ